MLSETKDKEDLQNLNREGGSVSKGIRNIVEDMPQDGIWERPEIGALEKDTCNVTIILIEAMDNELRRIQEKEEENVEVKDVPDEIMTNM